MAICIIPARGGSKRLPRKNIQELGGVPLISRTIQNAFDSKGISNVYVSTEDFEIAEISKKSGADVPFKRDLRLADDYVSTLDVIQDAISKLEHIQSDDLVLCLYPTAVFVTSEIINKVLNIGKTLLGPHEFLVSVKRFHHPIERALFVDTFKKIRFLDENFLAQRTQDLSTKYHDAGQFYLATKDSWMSTKSVFSNAIAFELEGIQFIDIDNFQDLEMLKSFFH